MPVYNPRPPDADKPKANLFPAGKFIVQVTDHELGETSGGYGQVIVTFGNESGQSRKAWLIYEGSADFQFDRLVKACDWNEPIDLEDVAAVRAAIYDKNVEIVVKSETYQGTPELKIKWINKAPGGTGQPRRTPADGYSAGHSAPRAAATEEPTPDDLVPF